MAEVNLLTQLYNDFIIVLEQAVIKYNILAEKYETLETKRDADAYVNASLMKDKFNTYLRYDKDIIADILGLDMTYQYDIVEEYYNDNSLIPYKLRDEFLKRQRKKIVDNYIEKNNYYRMLNGQPDFEDTMSNFVFVEREVADKYGINSDTPIHLLSEVKISLLQTLGYIDQLIEKYPDKKYLRFLGNRKIDIVTARTAKNFAVLRIPYDVSATMWDRFALTYEQCREYFMTCIYITEYRNTIDYYDNFIALCIMVMTIQQVIARVIKDTIERNFFDDYCVRTLFSVYGVPYYTYMDSGIKRQIVQDLNILVLNKGTNKVLYDIASILGYDRLKIYKYYLMKVQKFDINGVPVKYYKDETDPETGERILDYEKMYEVYFQKVELKDLDTYKSLLDVTNHRTYEEVTSGDPFWIEDDDLYKEVYESEYNFVETKYLGVSISYKLSKILFENVYLMKMIFEKKDEIPGILLSLPKVSPFAEVSLFDAIVALCAMTCKQNHLKGEILTRPSAIMHVIGFNFEKDFETIRKDIEANPYLDNSLTKFFKDSSTYTADGINNLYKNIVSLYDTIVDKMATTQNIEVYDAYRKFYESLYYTDENRKMFQIGVDSDNNPIYANTFMEYLQVMNPELFELIDNTDSDKFYEYVNHICQKIMAIIPDLKYLGVMSGRSETMEKMLVDLIRFFKSYTTDMLGLNILYIFDMKPELLLRLIDQVHIHKTIQPQDELLLSHADHLTFTSKVQYDEYLKLWDKIKDIFVWIRIFDSIHFNDSVHFIHDNIYGHDTSLKLYDLVDKILSQIVTEDRFALQDVARWYIELVPKDTITFWEYITSIIETVIMNSAFTTFDVVSMMYIQTQLKDKNMMYDVCKTYITLHAEEKLSFKEFVRMTTAMSIKCQIPFTDVLLIIEKLHLYDKSMNLKDTVRWKTVFHRNDALKFTETILSSKASLELKDNSSAFFDFMDFLSQVEVHEKFGLQDTCKISYSD